MRTSLRAQLFHHKKFRRILFGLVILAIVLGVLVVPFEQGSGNIDSISEGLWWAAVTTAGVGYGDYTPVTAGGRMIGLALMATGVTSLGLLISIMSSALTKRQEEALWHRLFERIDSLESRLIDIEKKSEFLVRDQHEKIN